MSGASFGPWRPGLPEGERVARIREVAAVACLIVGRSHPLVAALRSAETDTAKSAAALEQFDALPALKRRHILAACCNLGWRP